MPSPSPTQDIARTVFAVLFIGGPIAFGLVGIFIGPMVLAVSYRLLQAWVSEELAEPVPAAEREQQAG